MSGLTVKGKTTFNQFKKDMAVAYGVQGVSDQFAVEPTIAQTLNDQITLKADFLGKISTIPVDEIKGEKVYLGVSQFITGRTDTSGDGERTPVEVADLDSDGYDCVAVESDVALRFATIDAWAKFPNFREKYSDAVQKQIALNRIAVGWNGVSVAKTTDKVKNPLGQDVNEGWLQYMRINRPQNIMTGGNETDKIRIGKGGDYENLSAAVYDLKYGLHETFQNDPELVCIVGENLIRKEGLTLHQKYGGLPTEKQLLQTKEVIQLFGGLPPEVVPYFPKNGLVITTLANLALYWQQTSWRRYIIENPKKNRVEDYQSRNEDYVVQEPQLFVGWESDNVVFMDEKAEG